jgi:hypothetical protein
LIALDLARHCERIQKLTQGNKYKKRKQKERLAVLIENAKHSFSSPSITAYQPVNEKYIYTLASLRKQSRQGWIASRATNNDFS